MKWLFSEIISWKSEGNNSKVRSGLVEGLYKKEAAVRKSCPIKRDKTRPWENPRSQTEIPDSQLRLFTRQSNCI